MNKFKIQNKFNVGQDVYAIVNGYFSRSTVMAIEFTDRATLQGISYRLHDPTCARFEDMPLLEEHLLFTDQNDFINRVKVLNKMAKPETSLEDELDQFASKHSAYIGNRRGADEE